MSHFGTSGALSVYVQLLYTLSHEFIFCRKADNVQSERRIGRPDI